ncbi:hypothetical protein A2U01_0119529, partial [Trifolium medium]|nr:hypothetical protein [Trifolium medium]
MGQKSLFTLNPARCAALPARYACNRTGQAELAEAWRLAPRPGALRPQQT